MRSNFELRSRARSDISEKSFLKLVETTALDEPELF